MIKINNNHNHIMRVMKSTIDVLRHDSWAFTTRECCSCERPAFSIDRNHHNTRGRRYFFFFCPSRNTKIIYYYYNNNSIIVWRGRTQLRRCAVSLQQRESKFRCTDLARVTDTIYYVCVRRFIINMHLYVYIIFPTRFQMSCASQSTAHI